MCLQMCLIFFIVCSVLQKHLSISLPPFYSLRKVVRLYSFSQLSPSSSLVLFSFTRQSHYHIWLLFLFFQEFGCVLNFADVSPRFVWESSHAIGVTVVHDPVISGLGKLRILTSPWPLKILCLPAITFHLKSSFLPVCCKCVPGILFLVSDLCLHRVSSPFKINTAMPLSQIYLSSHLPHSCQVFCQHGVLCHFSSFSQSLTHIFLHNSSGS